MSEETTPNQNPPETPPNPTAGEARTPSVSKEHAPSTSEPEATDIPSANAPDPKAAAAKKAAKPAAEGAAAEKPPKKEKAPAVEDKPFADFMQQDYLPALKSAFSKQGIEDLELSLQKQKIPVAGFGSAEECWQAIGRWQGGKRQFNLYFPKADINGPRAFSCADSGAKPSTIEPFLIDERKITIDLLVFGVIQRLNAQKWLARN